MMMRSWEWEWEWELEWEWECGWVDLKGREGRVG